MCSTQADGLSRSADNIDGREILPTNVKPLHYNLTLEPNFDNFTYDGTVVIDLQVNEETNFISLNSNEIEIHSAAISSQGSVIEAQPDISLNKDIQVVTISFSRAIPAGSDTQLTLVFTGILNENMAGFYRSSYKMEDGKTEYLAATQMEATDARRAFPCFDEPSLKARFTLTLIADKSMTCLGNMDVASESDFRGKKAVKFNTSPLMSTYLIAFVVGHLNFIESNSFHIPIRVYATPEQDIEHGRFSLELAAKTLDFYEKAFDSQFPLPKMDMVAIPDFEGAMENWGLITYQSIYLLLDEKTISASRKQIIAETVQHELAHQWFGNLVTMDFWDGLWLNEGFATWMSWYSFNVFYPEWKVWENYVVDNLQDAFSLDSLRSSHPIEVPVKRTDEINQIFDAISYCKGSSVLRMISKYLGEDVLLQGVQNYIKTHAYGNTKTSDLWAALANTSGKPVKSVMETWTKNVGFPVISVTEDKDSSTIHVKQNRFLQTNDVRPDEDTVIYPVMLALRTTQGVEELMLAEREGSFKVPDLDFFKLNADHSGLYRTSYSPERLALLGKAAKLGKLTVEDRAGMIADAGALAASGHQRTSSILELLQNMDSETEFVVWSQILNVLETLHTGWIFENGETKEALKCFQRKLVSDKAHELGWQFSDGDDHVRQQFKALLFGSAGIAKDATIVQAAKYMFGSSAIHPNIRDDVFRIVLKHGGAKEYDLVLDRFRNSPSSEERFSALGSLGAAEDPALIRRTLDLTISTEVKSQDITEPLSCLQKHAAGIEASWSWVKSNWDSLVKRLPPSLDKLGRLVQMTTSSFCTEEQMKDVEGFFSSIDAKDFDRSLEQSLDAIRVKIHWLHRDREDVATWLSKNKYLKAT
ncbi:uncharacterized protein N7498_006819 [Penicillium cinerascens]|uniref:Aminopeptidase n=1 Tax=Penicillium cinerascens TaxID=70096 RepID=A0A9W9MIU3_9EURO|nr:uncharacterized protein N7498_006819 [Penicillium cinerascens]KAJ5202156.1 hypothetical protein N7498_006819 [Penicillium cinerascens]